MYREGQMHCDVCGTEMPKGTWNQQVVAYAANDDAKVGAQGVIQICADCLASIPLIAGSRTAWLRRQVIAAILAHGVPQEAKAKRGANRPSPQFDFCDKMCHKYRRGERQ